MDRKGRFNMMGVNVDQNVGKRRIQKTLTRRAVSEPRTVSKPRAMEATHVHEVQMVPVSEPRAVEAVETVEESCENQSSSDDAEWTDSGELVSEDTSIEENSEEANVEEGKAADNDEEEIHWSSDEFEGLEFDDGGEVEREEGFMLEKGKVYGNIHLFWAALAGYAVHKVTFLQLFSVYSSKPKPDDELGCSHGGKVHNAKREEELQTSPMAVVPDSLQLLLLKKRRAAEDNTVGFPSKFTLRRWPLVMASAAWEEEEWELCNDDGFVYRRKKRRQDLNGAIAATEPPATDPEADQRQLKERRKMALLKLKDQYQREIDQWQRLSDSLQAMENRTQPPPSSSPSSSSMVSARPQPRESESACRQLIDDLLLQAEAQETILQDLSNLCDMAETVCTAQEERLKQSFIDLPVWASPRALMASLSDD
ncbi:hypothetical protein NE237_006907 [Protea cynaroides]|uniref:Uncharacterized protein n=1 Tax=Protea cynaroides TaxID=273540 RepID=A0A9Q0KNB9_9MAGN|nr:hypothetical protein NE237_006907 [Protea cynaroides]